MTTRADVSFSVAALAAGVAAVALFAGCPTRHEDRVGPTAPIVVTLLDTTGARLGGVDVVSTKSGVVIDVAQTAADGTATLSVATNSEVTAHVTLAGSARASFTWTNVSPGDAPRIPILVTPAFSGSTSTVSFGVTIAPFDGFLTEIDGSVGGCPGAYVGTVGTAVSGLSVVTIPSCRQSDGSFSLWATANESGAGPTYYGARLDLTPDAANAVTSAGVVALVATTAAVPYPVVLENLPASINANVSSLSFTPIRRGAPIGPSALANVAAGANGGFSAGIFTPGLAHADAGDLELDLATPIDAPDYARYFVTRVTQVGTAATFDAGALTALPGDLDLLGAGGGRPSLTFTDPGGTATAVRAQISWVEPDGAGGNTGHSWYVYLREPATAATVVVDLPPVPASLDAFRAISTTSMNVALDYIAADFIGDFQSLAQLYEVPPSWRTVTESTTTKHLSPH